MHASSGMAAAPWRCPSSAPPPRLVSRGPLVVAPHTAGESPALPVECGSPTPNTPTDRRRLAARPSRSHLAAAVVAASPGGWRWLQWLCWWPWCLRLLQDDRGAARRVRASAWVRRDTQTTVVRGASRGHGAMWVGVQAAGVADNQDRSQHRTRAHVGALRARERGSPRGTASTGVVAPQLMRSCVCCVWGGRGSCSEAQSATEGCAPLQTGRNASSAT
jgi:hypothetical protein